MKNESTVKGLCGTLIIALSVEGPTQPLIGKDAVDVLKIPARDLNRRLWLWVGVAVKRDQIVVVIDEPPVNRGGVRPFSGVDPRFGLSVPLKVDQQIGEHLIELGPVYTHYKLFVKINGD